LPASAVSFFHDYDDIASIWLTDCEVNECGKYLKFTFVTDVVRHYCRQENIAAREYHSWMLFCNNVELRLYYSRVAICCLEMIVTHTFGYVLIPHLLPPSLFYMTVY
jgi:hypothetical protein